MELFRSVPPFADCDEKLMTSSVHMRDKQMLLITAADLGKW